MNLNPFSTFSVAITSHAPSRPTLLVLMRMISISITLLLVWCRWIKRTFAMVWTGAVQIIFTCRSKCWRNAERPQEDAKQKQCCMHHADGKLGVSLTLWGSDAGHVKVTSCRGWLFSRAHCAGAASLELFVRHDCMTVDAVSYLIMKSMLIAEPSSKERLWVDQQA